jgi:hypothetical protein
VKRKSKADLISLLRKKRAASRAAESAQHPTNMGEAVMNVKEQLAMQMLAGNQTKVDWQAYWLEFKKLHGEPVPYQGRLLFPDAWTYANNNYAGPEYPPPKRNPAAVRELAIAYWVIRKRIDTAELKVLVIKRHGLEQAQSQRSAPLQASGIAWDEEKGKAVRVTAGVDLSAIEGRIEWLAQDAADCRENLNRLNATPEEIARDYKP